MPHYGIMLLLQLLLVVSAVLIRLSLACVSPYQPADGLCVYRHPTVTSSVCEAAKICQDRSGVIISPDDLVQSGLSVPSHVWVSVSDSLIERGSNRDGWRYFNGSEFKNTAQWFDGEPSNNGGSEDFTIVGGRRLLDTSGFYNAFVYCSYEERAAKQSATFREDASLATIFNTGTEQGCYEIEVVRSRMECSVRCLNKGSVCRSFYHSAAKKQCVMVMYTDSTLPPSYTAIDHDWKRFVLEDL